MSDKALLDRLHRYQDEALAIMREVDPLLADAHTRDVAALARLRWALMRALSAYTLFKHGRIFDPAIARRLLGESQRAERMKLACTTMGDEFQAHVARWSARDVAGEWDSYQPAARTLMARLRSHIARERAEIEAMLAAA